MMGNREGQVNLKPLKLKISLAFALTLLLISSVTNTAFASGLQLSTWNIAWLSTHSYPQFSESERSNDDFSTLSNYFSDSGAKVLAFQEVDSAEAIQKVVGPNYTVYLSDRSHERHSNKQFKDINQYTGFAVHNQYKVVNHPDLDLNVERNGKLRFATYIELKPKDSQMGIHILSIHLKAGCQGAKRSNRSCHILEQQGKLLNQWIAQKENLKQPYLIMGDFNHNLAYRGDWLWEVLVANNTNPVLATKNTPATCEIRSNRNPQQTHKYRNLIDHIIISSELTFTKPMQNTFSKSDVINRQLSDHCPLSFSVH